MTEKKTLCRVPSVWAVFLQIQFDYYEKNRLQSVNKCDNIFLVNTNVFLVRISPFNAAGKRQTSFVSCDVMPDIEEDLDVEINDDDLRIDTYRSSGAGGQHINKTSSAIRITHIPTGIVVQCQNERSQFQNKDKAMQMLKAKLYMLKQQANAEKLSDIRGDIKDIGWGSQIRSYVLQPYTMVKDHRTGFESGNVNAVLDGGLDGFISAFLKWESLGRPQVKGGQDVE